jgi:hypothetical protein
MNASLEILSETTIYNDDETSATNVYICAATRLTTNIDEIATAVKAKFPATRCQHDYDCCANWYDRFPRWDFIPNLPDHIIVTQQSYINI